MDKESVPNKEMSKEDSGEERELRSSGFPYGPAITVPSNPRERALN